MAEEFKVLIGAELKSGELDNIKNQINNMQTTPIKLTINAQNVQSQINSIKSQIQSLSNIKINLGVGSSSGSGGVQKTVNDVNNAYKDLVNLQRRISSIRIQLGGLDSSKNSSQITELSGQLNRLMADYNKLYSTFSKKFSTDQIDSLNRAFETTNGKVDSLNAKMADSSGIQKATSAYKELYDISKQISTLELKIGSLDTKSNSAEITELQNQLNNLRQVYQQVQAAFQGSLTPTQLSSLSAVIYDTQDKLNLLDAKIADTKAKLAGSIQMKLGTSEFTKDIANIELGMSKLSIVSTELSAELSNMRASLNSMKSAEQSGNMDAMVSSYRDYETALKSANNQLKEAAKNQQMYAEAQKLTAAKTTLSNQMDIWLQNNSAAARQFGSQIQTLKAELQSCDATRLNGIKSEFQQITQQAQLAGKATQSFGDRFHAQLSKLGTYMSAAMLITQSVRALRSMYDNVVQVDTAMTGLYRVTNLSANEYSTMYSEMTQSAKEYGSTLTDIIDSTTNWVKLGFDSSTAQDLAEITTMYQHVTDLDTGTAVTNLITAYKGFQDQLLELYNGDSAAAVEYVADIFDKLGNEYAVSAADVGTALTKCASAMQVAGNSIQETSAMATGITEVTQNADKAGSALKILSMRLRGTEAKDLEEMGEDTEGLISNTGKLRDTIKDLAGVDIMIDDSTFKSTYEQMDAIAGVYHELADTDQAKLLETIAGKNRASEVAALINNWEQVKSAVEAANGAEGTAAAENEKFMASLQGKLNSLTTAWQALSNSFLKSDFLGGLIEGLTGALEVLDTLVNTFGTLPTLATALSAALSVKGVGAFKVMDGQIKLFGGSITSVTGNITKMTTAISRYNAISSKSASFQAAYNNALANSDSSMGKYLSGLNGAKASFSGYIASLVGAKVASFALQAATMALNMALTMGISLILSGIVSALQKWANAAKEAREASLETGNAAKEEASNLTSLYNAYQQANSLYASNKISKNELESATSSLLSALGLEQSEIEELVGKYGDLNTAINEVTADSLKEKLSEMTAGYQASVDTLLETTKDGWFSSFSLMDFYDGDNTKKFASVLEKAGLINSGSFGSAGGSIYLGDNSSIEGVIEMYQKLIDMRKALDDAVANGEFTREEMAGSDLYSSINSKIDSFSEEYKDVLSYIEEINDTAAQLQIMDAFKTDGIPQTQAEFESLRDSMMATASESGEFVGTQKQIEDSITNTLSAIPELAQYFEDYNSSLADASGATEEQLSALKESFKDNDVSTWFDSLSDEDKQLIYEISVKSDDTTLWTLTKWQEELNSMQTCSQTTEESLKSFYDTMNNTDDGNFSETVDNYLSTVDTLKDALSKIDTGELTDTEKVNLVMDFPELAGKTGDLSTLRQAIQDLIGTANQGIDDSFAQQLKALGGEGTAAGQALLSLKSIIDAIGNTSGWDFDIDNEVEKFNNLYDAMKESVSGTGLSSQGIKNVEAMFSGLEGYDPTVLFERTENGIHLNTTALRALQAQYESTTKLGIQEELQNLKQKYNDTKTELEGLTEGTDEYNQKAAELSGIEGQIQNVQTLAAQYEGLTSAYNKWIMAQSAGEEGDMYDNVTGSLEDIKKLYDDGLVGTNAFRSAVQLMTNEDLSTANIDQIVAAYEQGYPKMERYFTDSQDGCQNFLSDIQDLNSEWAHMNEDGSWEINFGKGNDQEIADALGINVESVQMALRKLSDYGFDINLDSAYTSVDELKSKIEESEAKLKELGQDPVDIDVNAENVDAEIKNAKAKIEEIKNSDASVDVKTAQLEDANNKLDTLISKKIEASQPAFMSLDVSSVDASISEVLGVLQEYQTAVNNLEALKLKGADTSEIEAAQGKVDELAGKIQGLDKETKVKVGLEADGSIDSIKSQIANDEVKIGVTADTSKATSEIANIEGEDVKVNVTTSGNEAIDNLKSAIDGITDKTVTITANTVGNDNVSGLKSATDTLVDKTVTATANAVGKENVSALKTAIDSLYNKTVTSTAKVVGTALVTGLKSAIDALYDRTVSVGASVFGTSAVYALKGAIDSLYNKTVTATTVTKQVAGVDGTAHAQGTAYANGTAFSQGDWGTKESGVALGGELGQELVVRNGKFFTIGDNAAEFFKYQKGDIVFNAAQTKEIFEKGKITHGDGRGKALVEGTAFSSGSGSFRKPSSSGGGGGSSSSSSGGGSSSGSSGSGSSGGSSSSSSSDEPKEETFDWIEIAINRIERAIDRLSQKAENVYQSFSSRNTALKQEMSEITNEINLQSQGYNRYIQQANSVGLSEGWASKVRDGSIDISTITDENLIDQIKDYQEWYEKALDCKDAIDQLNESLSELYETAFKNIATQYDGILSKFEHQSNLIESYIKQAESQGYMASTVYYKTLQDVEKKNMAQLKKEQTDLIASLNNAVDSGAIKVNSEAWYDLQSQINDVTEAIVESENALIEYGNEIRQIKWDRFDYLQDTISQITKETDFLISLMDNKKLYDDSGQLTDDGMATMGMHGLNYNTYMEQSLAYARELDKIDKDIANNPNDTNLLQRRQELLELQQEMILAAEDEKDAMVDMVREGIELELDALDDLIKSYTDAIDAQKNLYDYQKKIAEQTKNIAEIQKEMSAYENDDSEEAKKKKQELQTDLEKAQEDLKETEYEQYISDQKQLLDTLYNEYETVLNQRLDNIDMLISDMITEVNANASTISTTLSTEADNVGYTLSTSMRDIWNTESMGDKGIKDVLTTYSGNFSSFAGDFSQYKSTNSTQMTNLQSALGTINTNISALVTAANKKAESTTSTATGSGSQGSGGGSSSTPSTPSTPTNPSANGNGIAAVGERVKFNSGRYYEDSYGQGHSGYHNQGGYVYITKIHSGSPYPYHISTGSRLGSGDLGWLKLSQLSGYATGKQNFTQDEMAWTQEEGREFIVSPSDGAVLTPIAKKSSVLTADASNNIWDMANDPSKFIADNFGLGSISLPNTTASTGSNMQNFENVNFVMPNVKNYTELLNQMRQDSKFELLVQAMTTDRLSGRSSLAKNKIKF